MYVTLPNPYHLLSLPLDVESIPIPTQIMHVLHVYLAEQQPLGRDTNMMDESIDSTYVWQFEEVKSHLQRLFFKLTQKHIARGLKRRSKVCCENLMIQYKQFYSATKYSG